jgi:3-oxoacyl-[acyl-carrier-protein] synthase-3
MDGAAVFDWAVSILCDSVQDVIQDAGISVDDVDLFVFHQANIRILRAASDLLGIPRSKVFSNLEKYGNTSAGSVPLALDEAIQSGQIRPGQRIVLSGFGAGLAWCTAIVRW